MNLQAKTLPKNPSNKKQKKKKKLNFEFSKNKKKKYTTNYEN